MYGYYGFYWDPTYYLVVIGAIICLIASARVKGTFNRYNRVRSASGMTGAQAAEHMLRRSGIYDVTVQHVSGNLTDHYDPRNKTLNLSDPVYNSTSVSAIGVAAHECGHAIQHQRNYFPLTLRSAIVPVANLGSTLSWPLIIIGLLFKSRMGQTLIMAGVIAFSLAVLFQLVTLPVEFNASARALRFLNDTGMLSHEELKGTKKVLKAAALTYVASAAAAMLIAGVLYLNQYEKLKKTNSIADKAKIEKKKSETVVSNSRHLRRSTGRRKIFPSGTGGDLGKISISV